MAVSNRPDALGRVAGLFDLVSFWVLCAGAFLLPLAFFSDTFDRFVLPKLLFARLLALTLLALRLLRWAIAGRVTVRRTPLDLPLVGFLLAALVASGFAVNQNVALFGMYLRYEGLLTLGLYVALYWLTTQTLQNAAHGRTLIRTLIGSAYLVSLYAILQWVSSTVLGGGGLNGDFSFQGLPRAYATMGNPTVLAALLVMVLPAIVDEFVSGASLSGRLLAANAFVVVSLALGLTFARSAWLAAVLGVTIVLAGSFRRHARLTLAVVGSGAIALLLLFGLVNIAPKGGVPLAPTLLQRLVSLGSSQGSTAFRMHVWSDSVPLIANHPVVGYGPDTFALSYPRFETGQWGQGFIIDKAHAELVQIAATQGLLGVAAYLSILVAAGVAFWRGRKLAGALGAFGGVVAYQAWIQVNFSWVPAAAPFWIFLGAAVVIWGTPLPVKEMPLLSRRAAVPVATLLAIALLGLGIVSLVRTHNADSLFASALGAEVQGNRAAATANIATARGLQPAESRYALEAGRLALTPDATGRIDWAAVQSAYEDATQLGTYYASGYHNLAVADQQLGRHADAVAAAQAALELDHFDSRNQVLLNDLLAS